MRVPDGPGEAPEGLLGGCKMLTFHWCYIVLTFAVDELFVGMFGVRGSVGVLPTCAL